MPIELAPPADDRRPEAPDRGTVRGLLSRELSWGTRRVTARDRMFFTEQLALLLETGVPLHAGLEALTRQVVNPALARVVGALAQELAGGRAFAQALAGHPEVFSATNVNLVAAGEAGGFLHEVLGQLLAMEERSERLRATLVAALTYPAFLCFFSAAVVVFILAVVFPKFTVFFRSIQDQLPVTTVILMALSDLVRQYWIALLAGAGLGVFGLRRWLRRPEALALVDRAKLGIPVLRDVFTQYYLIQSLRVLGLSLANGVSVLDALGGCREVVRNRTFQAFIARVETQVTEGRGLAPAFQETAFIPPIVRQIVTTGEQTGNLALVMGRIADFYERELEKRVTALSKMAEPVMLLVMGALVGVLVSSLILPIFKLSRAVH